MFIHGISEHSGRHLPTVEALIEHGIECVRFDLRGAGRSGGRRQWILKFDDYVADGARVLNWIGASLQPLPLFVLGHSLGGAIAIWLAAEYGRLLRGLILSSPAYRLGGAISPVHIALGRVMARFVPGFRITGGDPSALSRNPQVGHDYVSDPLVCRASTVRQGDQVLRALDVLPNRCRQIHCPTLMVHGTADRVIRCDGTFHLFQCLAARQRELSFFPGGYHELHNDIDAADYFAVLRRWVSRQLGDQAHSSTSLSDPRHLVHAL